MNPAALHRDEQLFADALARPEHERAAFLDAACNRDAALRERILALLKAHAGPESLLASAPTHMANAAVHDEKPGDAIGLPAVSSAEALATVGASAKAGRYKLLQKIGEGGCGVVWMAEQEEPVRRRVALKIIKLGMDTKAVVARFEAERQALAMMDHPCIAKVHDAGSTDTGRPFFVMELVRGIPITKYCDENHLTPTARLELFIKVCQAVQHAHQKGIIHRDLKPSNILVTVNDGAPTPKIIDFGIAKATQGRLTDATVFTQFEQFIGTPAYMSPEQAEMSSLDIDTRSDIYSLGVLLYELLTGRPPFDPKKFAQDGVDQIRQQIREIEPPRPSARLSTLDDDERTTIARLRGTAAANLSIILRGDLDWIVMRCIEKDRTRRYDTANGLALDIERYLRNEPVVARPPSTAYLVQKLIRRHKFGFAAALAICGVVVAAAIVSTWLAFRATRAEQEQARLRRNEAGLRHHAEQQELAARESEQEQRRLRRIESELRVQAQAQELAARRRAYAADMQLAQQALGLDNLVRADELLQRHKPLGGEPDLRGWEWRYLWQQARPDFVDTLTRDPGGVQSLAASSDGKWLAMVQARERRISIWNLVTRRQTVLPFQGTGRTAFHPRDATLAAAAVRTNPATNRPEHHVVLWDVAGGKPVGELPLTGPCGGLFFSDDGARLVTGSAVGTATADGRIVVWRTVDATPQRTLDAIIFGSPMYVTSFAVTRDASLAAHGSHNRDVRLIDLSTGADRWLRDVAAEGNSVTALAFSPDGRVLATGAGGDDPMISLWDVRSGNLIRRLEGHRNWMASLHFWPDGKLLASACMDRTVRIWEVESGRTLKTLRGHKLDVWSLALLPDQQTLISGGKEGAVYLWNASVQDRASSTVRLPAPVQEWRFAEDSRSILTIDTSGTVTRWTGRRFQEKTHVMTLVPAQLLGGANERIGISVDLRHVFVCPETAPRELRLYNTETRTLRHTFIPSGGALYVPALFTDQRTLVVFDERDATSILCREWDLDAGREKRAWRLTLPGPMRGLMHIRPSPNGRTWLVRAGTRAAVFDVTTGASEFVPLAITGGIPQWSPDGRFLAIAAMSDAVTKLWDMSTHAEIGTLTGMFKVPHSSVFSPDSGRLAVGAGGIEALVLWDVESREALLSLEGSGAFFYRPAFSADGRWLGARSSVDANGTLHLWHAPSLEEVDAMEKPQAISARKP